MGCSNQRLVRQDERGTGRREGYRQTRGVQADERGTRQTRGVQADERGTGRGEEARGPSRGVQLSESSHHQLGVDGEVVWAADIGRGYGRVVGGERMQSEDDSLGERQRLELTHVACDLLEGGAEPRRVATRGGARGKHEVAVAIAFVQSRPRWTPACDLGMVRHLYVCMCVCVYVYTYVCVYVCVYVCATSASPGTSSSLDVT